MQNENKEEIKEIKEKTEEDKAYEKILEENKEEVFQEENQSVRIYIYGNKGNVMVNKYYNDVIPSIFII